MVPDVPSDVSKRQPPKPPKLLVQKIVSEGGKQIHKPLSFHAHIKSLKEYPADSKPIEARQTTMLPYKEYDLAPDDYKPKAVNSRYDYKQDASIPLKDLTVSQQAAYPIPYIPPRIDAFQAYPLLRNRAPDGTILGSYKKNYIDPSHVPRMDSGSTRLVLTSSQEMKAALPEVGPDNPVMDINDTWSSCWDEEVQAVYYYNKETGEATWIPPPI